MRKKLSRLVTVPGALAAAGVLALAAAGSASAAVKTPRTAGYQATGGRWHFRYVTAEFVVPQNACTGDDFKDAGIQLAGTTNNVAEGIACGNGKPKAGYQFGYKGTRWSNTWNFTTTVAAGNTIMAKLYYNRASNYVSLWMIDKTTNTVLIKNTHSAHGAAYSIATAAAQLKPATNHAPAPGTSLILVPFGSTATTSYDGTHGHGLYGPWGLQQVIATNGAHVIAAAPALYNNGTTFNVREYANS